MRNFIQIIENILLDGKLIDIDDAQMMGYWYNPASGKSFEVTWGDDEDNHHADMVMKYPTEFGYTNIPKDYFYDRDSEDIRAEVINKFGWVRVTITDNTGDKGLAALLEGRNVQDCHKTLLWVIKQYPEIISAYIETNAGYRVLKDNDMEWFIKKGSFKISH